MKNTEEVRQAYGLLKRVLAHLVCQAPDENAQQQFTLGAAAALAWTLDEDRPFSQMLACARTRTAPEKSRRMALNGRK
jgi:hypothetical protein